VASRNDADERRLSTELAVLGSASAPDLQRRLGISQATFSRLVGRLGERLLVTGKARARRYLARRTIEGLGDRVPVYAVDEAARTRKVLTLHAVLPAGIYVESLVGDFDSSLYPDLPYFLDDLRPSGFLGRHVGRQHPELELPDDTRLWSGTQTLRYLGLHGWNLPGNLIVGDAALTLYLTHAAKPPDVVEPRQRSRRYAELAEDALASVPGSSAGGEQPKFLVSRPRSVALLVKFSPPMTDAVGRRQAELLVAEHVAHRVLEKHGRRASRSALFVTRDRTFLEVERFDRTPSGGRMGVLSLLALDAQFVGRLRNWSDSLRSLVERKIVALAVLEEVRFLELFGKLIGNTDMHAANLSFLVAGERVLGLAPVYDMLPARYALQAGHVFDGPLELDPPSPNDAGVWDGASNAAIQFWRALSAERSVSAGFRRIAAENAARVIAWRRLGALLPSG
jgi:hypothetical protein